MAPSETQGPRTCVACKNNYAANSVSMFYPFPLKGVNNTNQKTTTQCLRCRRIASVRGAIRKQGRTVSRAAKIAILRRQERDLQQWRKDLRKVTAVPFAGDDLRNVWNAVKHEGILHAFATEYVALRKQEAVRPGETSIDVELDGLSLEHDGGVEPSAPSGTLSPSFRQRRPSKDAFLITPRTNRKHPKTGGLRLPRPAARSKTHQPRNQKDGDRDDNNKTGNGDNASDSVPQGNVIYGGTTQDSNSGVTSGANLLTPQQGQTPTAPPAASRPSWAKFDDAPESPASVINDEKFEKLEQLRTLLRRIIRSITDSLDEAPEAAGGILETMEDAEPEVVQKMIDQVEKLDTACQAALGLKRRGMKISTSYIMLQTFLDGENASVDERSV